LELAGLTRADWRTLALMVGAAPRPPVRAAQAERLIERGLAELIRGEAVLTAAGHAAARRLAARAEAAPAVRWRTRAARALAAAAGARP
jgi:hypothetical protein